MNGYEWQTHQPLIGAALEIYKPEFVLELGVGYYSTPLFLGYGCEYRGIDTASKWATEMEFAYDISIELHDISFIEPELIYSKLTDEERAKIREYYEGLKIPIAGPRLLFADQDATCRLISINTLAPQFDIIIYHDHDDIGFKSNSYDLVNRDGFNSYFLSTQKTGAGLMVRWGLDVGFEKTNEAVMKYMDQFQAEHPECTEIRFQRYE